MHALFSLPFCRSVSNKTKKVPVRVIRKPTSVFTPTHIWHSLRGAPASNLLRPAPLAAMLHMQPRVPRPHNHSKFSFSSIRLPVLHLHAHVGAIMSTSILFLLVFLAVPPLACAVVCPPGFVSSLSLILPLSFAPTPPYPPVPCFPDYGRVPPTCGTCANLRRCDRHPHRLIFRLPTAINQHALHQCQVGQFADGMHVDQADRWRGGATYRNATRTNTGGSKDKFRLQVSGVFHN